MPKSRHPNGVPPITPTQLVLPGISTPWSMIMFRQQVDPQVRVFFGISLMPDAPVCSLCELRVIEHLMGLPESVVGTHQSVGWFFHDLYNTIAPGSSQALRTVALPVGVCMHRTFEPSTHAKVVQALRMILSTAAGFSDYETMRKHYGLVRVWDSTRNV